MICSTTNKGGWRYLFSIACVCGAALWIVFHSNVRGPVNIVFVSPILTNRMYGAKCNLRKIKWEHKKDGSQQHCKKQRMKTHFVRSISTIVRWMVARKKTRKMKEKERKKLRVRAHLQKQIEQYRNGHACEMWMYHMNYFKLFQMRCICSAPDRTINNSIHQYLFIPTVFQFQLFGCLVLRIFDWKSSNMNDLATQLEPSFTRWSTNIKKNINKTITTQVHFDIEL